MSENESYPICNTEAECYARIAEIDQTLRGVCNTIDAHHDDIDSHRTYIETVEKEIADNYLAMSVLQYEKIERLTKIIDLIKNN